MFTSAEGIGIGIWVEVEYLDEDGQVQKRQLGKGIWPVKTTQINGFRSVQHTDQPITAETTGSGFQISVLMWGDRNALDCTRQLRPDTG